MTIVTTLKEATKGRYTFTAEAIQEKQSKATKYRIITELDGIAINTDKASKTTWETKFNELTK